MRDDFRHVRKVMFPDDDLAVRKAIERTVAANKNMASGAIYSTRFTIETLAAFEELIGIIPTERISDATMNKILSYGAAIGVGIESVADNMQTVSASRQAAQR